MWGSLSLIASTLTNDLVPSNFKQKETRVSVSQVETVLPPGDEGVFEVLGGQKPHAGHRTWQLFHSLQHLSIFRGLVAILGQLAVVLGPPGAFLVPLFILELQIVRQPVWRPQLLLFVLCGNCTSLMIFRPVLSGTDIEAEPG